MLCSFALSHAIRCSDVRINQLGRQSHPSVLPAVPSSQPLRLSWVTNDQQTGYQITLFSANGSNTSPKIMSNQSHHVLFSPPIGTFAAFGAYNLTVRVFDGNGVPSDWAPATAFVTLDVAAFQARSQPVWTAANTSFIQATLAQITSSDSVYLAVTAQSSVNRNAGRRSNVTKLLSAYKVSCLSLPSLGSLPCHMIAGCVAVCARAAPWHRPGASRLRQHQRGRVRADPGAAVGGRAWICPPSAGLLRRHQRPAAWSRGPASSAVYQPWGSVGKYRG